MDTDFPQETQIIDTTFYSIGFPSDKKDVFIRRENYIIQIDDFINERAKLIFLDGDEDAGKTTLLAQYAKENNQKVISVFFNPFNQLDYTLGFFCTNIVYQIKYLLGENVNLEDSQLMSIDQYQQYIFQARKFKRKLTIIIDGLEEKMKVKNDFIKQLGALLPLGDDAFNIIITGSENDFKSHVPTSKLLIIKRINLTGFSELEILSYLNNVGDITEEKREIFKITKGYPGRLKTLKRLLQNENSTIEQITNSNSYKNWLELDCNCINISDPKIASILSIFSLNDKYFTIDEVSSILSIETKEVKEILLNISALESKSKHIEFVSNSHKKYFSNLLRGSKKLVQDLLINYYSNEQTINSQIELTQIYSDRQDWNKVLNIIDESYPEKILQVSESFKTVSDSLKTGLLASEKTNRYTQMWRFSLENSLVNEMDNYLFSESEVRALISIANFTGAVVLAETALVKIDRLRLLALIARREKELNNHVDETLIESIQSLYKTTDLNSSGEKIYDIVADLIYAIPNLAIDMIEKSSGKANENNINDWIVAKLSVAAIDSTIKEKEDIGTSKKITAIENLKNPNVKKINKAITFLVANYSSIKVIEEVGKLSESNERLKLLRLWLSNNKKINENIGSVIKIALDELIISSSDNTITIDVLKELSDQLHLVKDNKVKDDLYFRFKKIENSLDDLGPTRNKYIYKLNMFHVQFQIDNGEAEKSIVKLLKEIEHITDKLVKVEVFAEAYHKLATLKYRPFYPKINFIYSRLISLSKELFKSTAKHYELCSNFIKTIARSNPNLGLIISDEINISMSREKVRSLISDSYLANNLKYVSIDILKNIENKIKYRGAKFTFHLDVLERHAESKSLHFQVISQLLYFAEKIQFIDVPTSRIYGYVQMLKIVFKNDEWRKRLSRKYENLILDSWEKIDADWEKIEFGFSICSDLAKINPDFAKKLFFKTSELKENCLIDSLSVATVFINSMRLVLRSFVTLTTTETEDSNDFKILTDLIDRIPSETWRLDLWTELGFLFYLNGLESRAKDIYNSHVIPLVDGLVNRKENLAAVSETLTFIYIFNPNLLERYTLNVPKEFIEDIYSNICDFFTLKRNPYEVYESEETFVKNSYSDLNQAICALQKVHTDSYLYTHINSICDTILSSKSEISKPQNITLIESLEKIVDTCLPDSENIQHIGYKLLSDVKIGKITRENLNHNLFYKSVIDQLPSIDNLSDRVFVKAILLEEIPFEKITSGSTIKTEIFNQIIAELEEFPSHYEYVERVSEISKYMYNVNRTTWKNIVQKAFSVCSEIENETDGFRTQKRMLDTMYRIDPDFAKELSKMGDKDNKEKKFQKLLSQQIEVLEMSKTIKNNKNINENEAKKSRIITRAIEKALMALNSGKISPKKMADVCIYLPLINNLAFQEVFPVYKYYLLNCAKMYPNKNSSGIEQSLHRDNYKRAVVATNLIEILSNRKKTSEKLNRSFFVEEKFDGQRLIHPGTKEDAQNFIKSWMVDEVQQYLLIADPYFQKEDLHILKSVNDLDREIEVHILGSKNGDSQNLEIEFKEYWKSITEQQPPFVNITFCWIPEEGNATPFHDRWILTENGGLRLGTSFNSLGEKKESEISVLKPSEANAIKENSLIEYVDRKKRFSNNRKIAYKSFSL